MKNLSLLYVLLCTNAHAAIHYSANTSNATIDDLISARQQTITDKQAYWDARPLPDTTSGMTGVVKRYCDCGTGASKNCVQGNDSTGNGSDAKPYRTVGAAATWLQSNASVGDTVALCKGGAFPTSGGLHVGSERCSAGRMCNDFREYSSTQFTSSAKPILYTTGDATLISDSSATGKHSYGGVRIMNLELKGAYAGADSSGILISDNFDIGIYNNYIHDFKTGVQNSEYFGPTPRVFVEANHIYHNAEWGYLGASDYGTMSFNDFRNNGGNTGLDHTAYVSQGTLSHAMKIEGNYMTGTYSGGTCAGTMMVSHSNSIDMVVKDNVIVIPDGSQSAACYGMAFSNDTANPAPVTFTNAHFVGNIILNGGNQMFCVTGCPNCDISNNILVQTDRLGGGFMMSLPDRDGGGRVNRGQDVDNTANHVVNNTFYLGPNSIGAWTALQINVEGTNHVVSNNVIYDEATSGSLSCFNFGLPLASYSFINNNNCHALHVSLTVDRSHTLGKLNAAGFETKSSYSAPNFVNAGKDFHPTGMPLSNAGNDTNKSKLDILGYPRPSPPAIGAYEP